MTHRLRIMVRGKASTAVCATCGSASRRVHSRYVRTLADLGLAGRQVEIRLRARRWFCSNEHCATKTFAEQVDGLTARYARRTGPLRNALEHIALALAGRAGARLANRLGLSAGRNSLLRLIRGLPDRASTGDLAVVGVDDFAVRRGNAMARSWSTSTLTGRSTCSRIAKPPLWRPGCPVTRRCEWCAVTAPAPTPTPRPLVLRRQSRSPTGGTCGTTWPSTWRRPPPVTAAASRRCNRHRPSRRCSTRLRLK
jgi:hypothetical protein